MLLAPCNRAARKVNHIALPQQLREISDRMGSKIAPLGGLAELTTVPLAKVCCWHPVIELPARLITLLCPSSSEKFPCRINCVGTVRICAFSGVYSRVPW